MRTAVIGGSAAILLALACSSSPGNDDDPGSSNGSASTSGDPNGSSGRDSNGNVTSGSDGTIGSTDAGLDAGYDVGLPYGFRYGINMGHRNPNWGDDVEGALAALAGAQSIRIKLPAMHLKTWGYDIEVGDIRSYASHAMKDHIGFLIGSESIDRSVAPSGSADWQNEYYIPKNLYEPIFGSDGNINPNNYWASYIYNTVNTYKAWVKVWHIWNEPDWTSNWQTTQDWKSRAPTAADLPRFNGSIFDYVRMLRIAKEAAKKADPESLIATGGIGYPNFLDAILRYSDNPQEGTTNAAYPATGAAYIDVVDFHYYPIFSSKSSDASADEFIASKKALADVLDARQVKIRGFNVSETGAPLATTTDYPTIGSPEYARNYLIKAMTLAQANGIGGVDWFILVSGDTADPSAFAHMGLYEDTAALATMDQAVKTDAGKAYKTLGAALGGAVYDAKVTGALALAAPARGVAFSKAGKRVLVLWAAAQGTSETGSANVSVATASGFDVVAWDGTASHLDANAGAASFSLTASPIFATER